MDPLRAFRIIVGSAIAYFNAKGYKLSAELLTHARRNNTIGSHYVPINGFRVRTSQVYIDKLHDNSVSGNITFPNSGNTNDKDLYFALHKVLYTKNSSTFVITDTYDFDSGNSSHYGDILGFAVDAIYTAQILGVINPFDLTITENIADHYKSCSQLNSTSHKITCSCGMSTTESHTKTLTKIANNSTYHMANCAKCGYSGMEQHIFRGLSNPDGSTLLRCNCGFSYTVYTSPTRPTNKTVIKLV